MRPSIVVLLGTLSAMTACRSQKNEPTLSRQNVDRGASTGARALGSENLAAPLVVELFTSQGCSSCPPADGMLTRIGRGEFGEDVIPLAYHVDYWDHIGWKDPFSKRAWSELQRQYSKHLPKGRVYTPMLVVGGRTHEVGSRRDAIASAIDEARTYQPSVFFTLSEEQLDEGVVQFNLSWTSQGKEKIYWAQTASGFQTPVESGENSGENLKSDFVAMSLTELDTSDGRQSANLSLKKVPKRENAIVVFARDPSSMAIVGASTKKIPQHN